MTLNIYTAYKWELIYYLLDVKTLKCYIIYVHTIIGNKNVDLPEANTTLKGIFLAMMKHRVLGMTVEEFYFFCCDTFLHSIAQILNFDIYFFYLFIL